MLKLCLYALQDYDNLINTFYPDLPQCFQVTALTWISCGFLWATLPFYAIYLYSRRSHYQNGNKTKLNIFKIVSRQESIFTLLHNITLIYLK